VFETHPVLRLEQMIGLLLKFPDRVHGFVKRQGYLVVNSHGVLLVLDVPLLDHILEDIARDFPKAFEHKEKIVKNRFHNLPLVLFKLDDPMNLVVGLPLESQDQQ
jgi:hypothetical protein